MSPLSIAVTSVLLMPLLVLLLERRAPSPAARAALAFERLRAGLRRREAEVPGASMPYLDGGSGEPVVLLHGFGADKDHFMRVAAHLTGWYRVIAPDLPGFGESPPSCPTACATSWAGAAMPTSRCTPACSSRCTRRPTSIRSITGSRRRP